MSRKSPSRRRGGLFSWAALYFAISVVANPLPGDSTVESDGAKVFLEPAASAVLDDKTLDAQIDNGSVTFALVPQL